MHLYDSELYMQDVCAVASMIEVQELADASVLISGGTPMEPTWWNMSLAEPGHMVLHPFPN